MPMKPKTSKQPKKSKRTIQLKDIKTKRDPAAGRNQGWGPWEVNPTNILNG
jgi:hypothetical protein